jgi:hypothetical protein
VYLQRFMPALVAVLAMASLGSQPIWTAPPWARDGSDAGSNRSLQRVAASNDKAPRPRGASEDRSLGPSALDHPPVQAAEEPATWSEDEIAQAWAECDGLLNTTKVAAEASKPIRVGQCGTPAPVLLRSVAEVEITPPAVVNCRVARTLHDWVEKALQPIANETFGATVTRLVNASAHTCRPRIGTSNQRLSEHSFANALDISAFVMSDGRTIDVLTHWGRAMRDQRAQAKVADGNKLAGGDPRPLSDVNSVPIVTVEGQFLRRLHSGACGTFGTVLGPEANEAHRNHLHLDLANRTRSAFCQ